MGLFSRARSDAELLARARVLIGSIGVYLLCMGFMALGDHFYYGTKYVLYTRLATIPFFLFFLRRWVSLVRVSPPQLLQEARKLMQMKRYEDAREHFEMARHREPALAARVDRARRVLQGALAVTMSQEIDLERARCSVALDELDRAASELRDVARRLPLRADVALELAEALRRTDREDEAAEVLKAAAPHLDAVDRQMLEDQPQLMELLGDTPLPRRSQFYRTVIRDHAILAVTLVLAVLHGLYLYL